MDNPLTLQEAKDQVAKRYCGMPNIPYASWKDMENALWTTSTGALNLLARTEEAAELYARSKWDEACEAQRKLCYRAYMDQPIVQGKDKFEGISNEMEAIINAPKSEFKP